MTRQARILFASVVITVFLAAADTLMPPRRNEPGTFALVASVGFGICAFEWLRGDARARKIEPPPGCRLLAAATAPFGLPVYFVWVLGVRRGLLATAKAIGFLLALSVAYAFCSYVVGELTAR